MANTITFKKGLKTDLPTTGLAAGEPLFVTDDKLLYVATASNASVNVGAEIDASPSLGTSHIKLATQGAIKEYIDSTAGGEGLSIKQAVSCASESNDDGFNAAPTFATTQITCTAAAKGAIATATGVFDTFAGTKAVDEPEVGDVITFLGGSGSGAIVTAVTGLGGADVTCTFDGSITMADDVVCTFTAPVGVGQTLTDGANTDVPVIDGVTITLGMRILLKDQTAAEQNGVWKVTTLGSAGSSASVYTRADDFNIETAVGGYNGVIDKNAFVFVGQGSNNANLGFAVSALGANFVVGASTAGDITWTQFTGASSVVAGVGLAKSGNTLALDISELSTVTPVSGDFFATLDSDGANEQKTSTDALATLLAGTGLSATSAVLSISNNAIGLDQMAGGTDGNLITFDTSGDPAYVATGTATHILTSNGPDTAPTFQSPAASTDVDVNVTNLKARLPQIDANVTIGDGTDITVNIAGPLTAATGLTVTGAGSTSTTMTVGTDLSVTGGDVTLGATAVAGTVKVVNSAVGTVGNAFTLTGSDVTAGSGTINQAGGAVNIVGGLGTGTGGGGSIVFKTSAAVGSGTGASSAAASALTLAADKSATFAGAASGITTLAMGGALTGATTITMNGALSGAVINGGSFTA